MNEFWIMAACVFVTAVIFYNFGKAVGFEMCANLFCEFISKVDCAIEEPDKEMTE